MRNSVVPSLIAVALLVALPQGVAAPRNAARSVEQGIQRHARGQYAAAERDFAEAAEAAPGDLRVVFDQGCALAAQQKWEEAAERFELSKMAQDPKLAAASWSNLGWIAAQRAREIFGEHPESASLEQQAIGKKWLTQAMEDYRSCLAVDPANQQARHNLELIRLWLQRMQEQWNSSPAQQQAKSDGSGSPQPQDQQSPPQPGDQQQSQKSANEPSEQSNDSKSDSEGTQRQGSSPAGHEKKQPSREDSQSKGGGKERDSTGDPSSPVSEHDSDSPKPNNEQGMPKAVDERSSAEREAEWILRKVRDREREYRQRQRKVAGAKTPNVDRDW